MQAAALPFASKFNQFSASTTNQVKHADTKKDNFTSIAKKYAGIIDSRESLVRLALEFFGGDIPWVAAAAFRNRQQFIERIFESCISFMSFVIAPNLTETFAKIAGKIYTPELDSKRVLNLVNLDRRELRSEEAFKQGVERVLKEEPADKQRIAKLYRSLDKNKQAERYEQEAEQITEEFRGLED